MNAKLENCEKWEKLEYHKVIRRRPASERFQVD